MNTLKMYEFWLIVGSQDLYGPEILKNVESDARIIAGEFVHDAIFPSSIVLKPVATSSDGILSLFRQANASPTCAGIITWMHTFSPSKMWIAGLSVNRKPLLHLHTQFNRDIPWSTIDMNFMNLNQSAHGDKEHGFIQTRMNLSRKVVVGHWQDPEVREKISIWMRAAGAFANGQDKKVIRFGDNMREVAVTEGNKVSAQIQFGWSVDGYGLGELVREVNSTSDYEVDRLLENYKAQFLISAEIKASSLIWGSVREQARIELGLRAFLEAKNAEAFTTTFEDLEGLPQLPGLAVQHLMMEGYGFGAEGDWKTAALVRTMKVMSEGLSGGTSFMEDYTYHLEPGNEMVLGAHMLEVCPSIARNKPRIEVHPLGIGGKADPARLVFEAQTGDALNATILDLGKRFRMVVNEVESVELPKPMPSLPVARVLWKPKPSFKEALRLWILAGGAHHTCYSTQVTAEMLEDYATIAGIEYFGITGSSDPNQLASMLRWNDAAW
jgi:L-arabinose isomerase